MSFLGQFAFPASPVSSLFHIVNGC